MVLERFTKTHVERFFLITSLYKSLKNIRGQFSKMDIFKMSKNENCKDIFFSLTEK
jgi:hypothetical protein